MSNIKTRLVKLERQAEKRRKIGNTLDEVEAMCEAAIPFTATVFKINTLVDGGIRLTLDIVPPTRLDSVMELMKAKQPGIILECAAVAVRPETCTELNVETEKEAERVSDKAGRRRTANRRDQRTGG